MALIYIIPGVIAASFVVMHGHRLISSVYTNRAANKKSKLVRQTFLLLLLAILVTRN